MKLLCSKCKKSWPQTEFTKAKSKRGFGAYCKQCRREYDTNKTKSGQRKQSYFKQIISFYKSDLGCCRCSESHSCCLEFHHKDSSDKTTEVSSLTGSKQNLVKISKEVAKCVILCSNCHKKLHAGLINVDNVPLCDLSQAKIEEIERFIKFQGV